MFVPPVDRWYLDTDLPAVETGTGNLAQRPEPVQNDAPPQLDFQYEMSDLGFKEEEKDDLPSYADALLMKEAQTR